MSKIPYITSEDISHYPDQAAFKLNRLIEAVNKLAKKA